MEKLTDMAVEQGGAVPAALSKGRGSGASDMQQGCFAHIAGCYVNACANLQIPLGWFDNPVFARTRRGSC